MASAFSCVVEKPGTSRVSIAAARLGFDPIRAVDDDPVAVELLQVAGAHVDALAQALVRLGADRLSLVGGLAASIEPWLAKATRRHLVAPRGDAVAGALQLARDAAESLHRDLTALRSSR